MLSMLFIFCHMVLVMVFRIPKVLESEVWCFHDLVSKFIASASKMYKDC